MTELEQKVATQRCEAKEFGAEAEMSGRFFVFLTLGSYVASSESNQTSNFHFFFQISKSSDLSP